MNNGKSRPITFGMIVGNRGFFPDHLAKTGREEIIQVLEAAGAKPIVLGPEESKYGAVETYVESQRCAELFKKHAEEIDGIIVTGPGGIVTIEDIMVGPALQEIASQRRQLRACKSFFHGRPHLRPSVNFPVPIRLSGYWKCCMQFPCRNWPLIPYTYKKAFWFL
jgi:hypothetical protein